MLCLPIRLKASLQPLGSLTDRCQLALQTLVHGLVMSPPSPKLLVFRISTVLGIKSQFLTLFVGFKKMSPNSGPLLLQSITPGIL